MSHNLYVLAAAYDDVGDALAEFDAIKAAYDHVGSTYDFDAAVLAKGEDGRVKIVRRHDEPVRHGTETGLGWGIAAGAIAALFPGIGIFGALLAGGGAGAALGAVAGHAASAMSRDDLKALGEVLDAGDAGLVVVYASDMADRVLTTVSRAHSTVRRSAAVAVDELADEVRAAERRPAGIGS
jgi:uncharacterized membrane protein